MDTDIDVQTAESGIRGRRFKLEFAEFIGQGFFFPLIPRHETKVGRAFYMVNCYFPFSF